MAKYRRTCFALLGVFVGLCLSSAVPGQDYPARSLRLIVPNSAGNSVDAVARLTAEELSRVMGQSIIVENKPGANWAVGLEYVARQVPADGYTVAIILEAALATLPVTTRNLAFDPLKDLVPVVGLTEGRLVLLSSLRNPWKSWDEMVRYSKSNPGKLNYGSSSTAARLLTEALIRAPGLGLEIVNVNYSQGAPMNQAIVVNEVNMGLSSEALLEANRDKIRALAVTGSARMPAHPDVPTFAELGYPHIAGLDYTLLMRAGTPKPFMDKFFASASKVLQQPAFKARISKLQTEVRADIAPEAAAKRVFQSAKLYGDMARQLRIQPE